MGNPRRSDQGSEPLSCRRRGISGPRFSKSCRFSATTRLITFIEAFGGFVFSLVLGVGFAIAVVYSRHLTEHHLSADRDSLRHAQERVCAADGDLGRLWIVFEDRYCFSRGVFPDRREYGGRLEGSRAGTLGVGARSIARSEFDVFKKIRLPNSLPYMFAGIKVAIVLSVTGAIVAEFVAANEGLGYLVLQANYSLDTAFALVILADFGGACRWGCFGWRSSFRESWRPGAPRCARSKALFSYVMRRMSMTFASMHRSI